MTHLDMARFRAWFDYVNAERLQENLPIIQPFYPYEFLGGRLRDIRVVRDYDDRPVIVKENAHKVMRRFVFLKATESDIHSLVYSTANQREVAPLSYPGGREGCCERCSDE